MGKLNKGEKKIKGGNTPGRPRLVECQDHLGPEASPAVYLQLLDFAFATVEDGEELFVRFMGTN